MRLMFGGMMMVCSCLLAQGCLMLGVRSIAPELGDYQNYYGFSQPVPVFSEGPFGNLAMPIEAFQGWNDESTITEVGLGITWWARGLPWDSVSDWLPHVGGGLSVVACGQADSTWRDLQLSPGVFVHAGIRWGDGWDFIGLEIRHLFGTRLNFDGLDLSADGWQLSLTFWKHGWWHKR